MPDLSDESDESDESDLTELPELSDNTIPITDNRVPETGNIRAASSSNCPCLRGPVIKLIWKMYYNMNISWNALMLTLDYIARTVNNHTAGYTK